MSSSTNAVERAASMLALFVSSDSPTLGITEIAQELGLSKAVVHRLLTAMQSSGLIAPETVTRRYRLGPLALMLGLSYLAHVDVQSLARPLMEHLSEITGETATLSLRQGWSRVYIDQVNPRSEVRMTVALGRPFPLHAGSSSKAMLAFMSESEQDEFFASQPLAPLTDATVTDEVTLREELNAIRELGYAHSAGERQAGAYSIAAPILDRDGAVSAVISVCGPNERFSPKWHDAVKPLLEGTRELSRQLGHKQMAG